MTLYSRHVERDHKLPRYRETLLASLTKDLIADPRVLAVFVAGSMAKGNADLYSDIDLRVVVKPHDLEYFVTEKKHRPNAWGEVLFYEDLGPKVAHTVAHYSGFVKVDIFYYSSEKMVPSLFLQDIHILHDPAGFMENLHCRSMSLVYRPSPPEVEFWRYKILAYAHEVYRRCMRGELSYARKMIIGLAEYAVEGWHMEAGRLPEGSKAEGGRTVLDPWQLNMLDAWNPCGDAKAVLETMTGMVPELSRLNIELSKITGCDPKTETWQRAWELVI